MTKNKKQVSHEFNPGDNVYPYSGPLWDENNSLIPEM